MRGFAGLENWFGRNAPVSSRICSAASIAASMRRAGSVSTSSAPYASSVRFRSSLAESGRQRMSRYPRADATCASPIPVLPEVGSTIVSPGLSTPRASASRIMPSAVRSLIDPPGFAPSSLIQTSAICGVATRSSRTTGVRPITASTR